MSKNVYWVLESEIQAGPEKDLLELMEEMVTATKADEPGTLGYEWNISEDGKLCHVFEHYADSAATLVHMGNFGSKFARRFLGILKPVRCTVYGSPSQKVKDGLAALGAVYMTSVGGFTR